MHVVNPKQYYNDMTAEMKKKHMCYKHKYETESENSEDAMKTLPSFMQKI